MKHFTMSLDDAYRAKMFAWNMQCAVDIPLSKFLMVGVGFDADLSADDMRGELLLRYVLEELCIPYTEHDKQQIFTGWE